MNEKRILIIKLTAINGLDSSVLRTLAFIKGALSLGYEVDWITIHASTTQVINEIDYDFVKKINVLYANKNIAYEKLVNNNSGIKKAIVGITRYLYRKFAIYNHTKKIADQISIDIIEDNRYEYVVSVSDPKTSHIAAKNLIKQGLRYEKWIQYWGDPMTLDITRKSIYPSSLYKNIERKLLSKCDKIIYTSPVTLDKQSELFPELGNKMKCVPTAFINEKIYTQKRKSVYTVGYYGAYKSNVRNILPFYNACRMLDAFCYIVGDTDLDLKSTDKIRIYPRGNITVFEEETDLFVCILNSRGTQIPGKIYHYAAYNKPVLVVMDGEYKDKIKDYFEQFGHYYFCENESMQIANTIRKIMAENVKFMPCSNFSPEKIAKDILNFE